MDTASREFKNMMLQFLSWDDIEIVAKNPETFTNFLASIKDTSVIYSIDENKVRQFNYDDFNGINGGGEDMQMSFDAIYVYYLKEKQENKNGYYKFNFNHLINISPSIKAIVYAIDSSETACPLVMRHIYHRLVTYDNTSNIIDSKIVALQSGEELKTVSFNDKKFSVIESKRKWKKPYDAKNFDNYLLSTEKTKEVSYEILDDGKINETMTLSSP